MKQKWLKIMMVILTLTLSVGTTQVYASEKATNDWSNHWAAAHIQAAMNKGWVLTANQFRPNDNITRAEFIKVVNRSFGFTTKESSEPFTDVNSSHWWYDEVRIAIKAGFITTTQSTFRPTDPLSREEAATIIARIKKIEDTNHDKIKKYSDYKKVASWAINGVEGVIEKKYMGQGITAFRPKDNITRAEAVVTINRVNPGTPTPTPTPTGIPFTELNGRMASLGWTAHGGSWVVRDSNGMREALAFADAGGAGLTLEQQTPKSNAAVKNALSLLLPTGANQVFNAMVNGTPGTFDVDGRVVEVYDNGSGMGVEIFNK